MDDLALQPWKSMEIRSQEFPQRIGFSPYFTTVSWIQFVYSMGHQGLAIRSEDLQSKHMDMVTWSLFANLRNGGVSPNGFFLVCKVCKSRASGIRVSGVS